ncbi:MAG: nucleotidyltransferase family protein, partial [Planctomycetota bacterium]|nr:nucleotidyltransferase family protein [Planctomycetota bacterium]
GERDLGDLDLLIRRERVVEVVSFLEKEGYHPLVPLEKILGGGGIYLNSISLYQESRFPIHLHWHVINASLPLFMVQIPVEELWEESRPTLVAGAPVRALAPHHLLVTVAEHSLKHSYETLIHLVDIDRIVRSGVDLSRSFSCARRWGVEESLQIGLYLCSKMLGTPVDVPMPRGILTRIIIHSVRKNRRWGGIGSLGYLSMAKGLRQKIRFLLGTFSPPSEEIHSFGKTSGLYRVLNRGWRALLGGRRLLGGKP